VLVRELLEQIERALRHQPIVVGREGNQLFEARRAAFDERPNPVRIGDAAPVAAAQQCQELAFHARYYELYFVFSPDYLGLPAASDAAVASAASAAWWL